MRPGPATAGLIFLGFGVLLAGAWVWLITAMKAAVTWQWIREPLVAQIDQSLRYLGYRPRLPLVAWHSRRPVPWALIDLIIIIGIYLIGAALISVAAREIAATVFTAGGAVVNFDEHRALVVGSIGISFVVLFVGLPVIAFRTGATARDFGWSPRTLGSDLLLGVIGFVMLAPPTYAIQGLLTTFWQPSKHPLVEMFKESPNIPLFALLFVSAAIVAPLFEEVVFRVLFQGFLERVTNDSRNLSDLMFGSFPVRDLQTMHETIRESTAEFGVNDIVVTASDNPYASPQSAFEPIDAEDITTAKVAGTELRGVAAWLPIGISSAIFALLHYSHGPDWIPLLLLAAGMGYLYQRTHSIVPSLVVHSLLNGMSMWGLWVTVKEGFSS